MSIVAFEDLVDSLICPLCSSPLEHVDSRVRCQAELCARHHEPFPDSGGLPVLVDFARSVLREEDVVATPGMSVIPRERGRFFRFAKRVLVPRNHVAERSVAQLPVLVGGQRPCRVLVVGGGVVGRGIDALYEDPAFEVVGFDIYASDRTQFVADGHQIPLADGAVDAVVIQAVLQCVLEPWVVAAEIHRVVRPGGVVYSEASFLQQVCEGPYDFTRFTESGHRYLFRGFSRVDSGVVAGPATVLLWTLDHLVRGVFRSRTAGMVAKGMFSWLRYLDPLLPTPYAVDSASAVFFLGTKTDVTIGPHDIIDHYLGAQR